MEEELNLLNKNLADRYKKSLSFFGASEKEEVNQVLRSVLDSVDTWDLSRSEKDSEKIFIVEDLMNRLSGVQSVRELTDSVRTIHCRTCDTCDMKHTREEAESEVQLLGECIKHKDIWSHIEKRFTLVDLMVLRNVSLELETIIQIETKPEKPLQFHLLKACRPCGHSSYRLHRCRPDKRSCEKDVQVFQTPANQRVRYFRSAQFDVNEYEVSQIDEKRRIMIVNLSIVGSFCPNWGKGDKNEVNMYQLLIRLGSNKDGTTKGIRYGYNGVLERANGICQGFLSREKILSSYEEEVMTRDFSCILQQ